MAGPNEYDARRIGAAARYDMQLRVPIRPRLRRGLVSETRDGTVVVIGTARRQTFKGAFAKEHLMSMLELTSGEHTHVQIAQELGLEEAQVFDALALLWKSGVIEDTATSEFSGPDVAGSVATQLSRLGDTTAANDSWELAAHRMSAVPVRIDGTGTLAEQLRALLPSCEQVTGAPGAVAADGSLVVVVHEGVQEFPVEVVDAAWLSGAPLLRVTLRGSVLCVGPYVRRGSTACLECLTATETDVPRDRVPNDAHLTTQVAAALAARQVHALLSRALVSHLPHHIRRTDTETFETLEYTGATRPGCRRCSERELDHPRPAPAGALYEAAVAIPSREFADIKGHQNHYKPANLALQKKFRTWPTCPRVPLTAPALDRLKVPWARATVPSASTTVTEEEISILLKLSVGIQDVLEQRVMRWTAAGGNIGSTHAFLAVRDCEGIEPGLYAYLEENHMLARLAGPVDGIDGDGPVTIILTGSHGKVAQKYGPFGLRVTLQDGGCALTSLAVAANALGIGIRTRNEWDADRITRSLTMVPEVELITSVTDVMRVK